tara:strand:+ start:641 stop:1237 length:597 start_codon:yes stop_codon:yes gene_type:complete
MPIKVNKTKQELEQSIRVRRDALQFMHQQLQKESDNFQLAIMGISTFSGSVEVTKMTLNLDSPYLDLTAIFMASICTILASYMRFRNFNQLMEGLIKASSELTSVLKMIRDTPIVNVELIEQYNRSLAITETCLYPNQRKKYFAIAEKGVVAITTDELKFNKNLDKAEKKHAMEKTDIEKGNSNEIVVYNEEEEEKAE